MCKIDYGKRGRFSDRDKKALIKYSSASVIFNCAPTIGAKIATRSANEGCVEDKAQEMLEKPHYSTFVSRNSIRHLILCFHTMVPNCASHHEMCGLFCMPQVILLK